MQIALDSGRREEPFLWSDFLNASIYFEIYFATCKYQYIVLFM
jgi:hypothetical protein